MTLDKILDRMDDLLSESVSLPLSNRKLGDVEKMQDLLDELRRNLPQEIKDAKGVVLDRDSIIEQAENQAEDIIQKAEVRARQMISEEEIFKAAGKGSCRLAVGNGGHRYYKDPAWKFIHECLD